MAGRLLFLWYEFNSSYGDATANFLPLAQPICSRERLGRRATASPFFNSVEQHPQHGDEDGYAEQSAGAHPKSGFEKNKTRIGIEYVGLAVRTKTSFVGA